MEKVIEGAYEVLSVFDQVEEKRDAMQWLMLPPPAQQALAKAALTYRFGEEHQPVTESQLLAPRRWQDESDDLWTTYQRIQENLIKGGLNGRAAKGGRTHTRAIKGIDGDVRLTCALWVMAENMFATGLINNAINSKGNTMSELMLTPVFSVSEQRVIRRGDASAGEISTQSWRIFSFL